MSATLYVGPVAGGNTAYAVARARAAARGLTATPAVVVASSLQVHAFQRRLAAAGGAMGVHVSTLPRFCQGFLSAADPPRVLPPADVLQRLLEAASSRADMKALASLADKPGFWVAMRRLIAEAKATGISPDRLERAADAVAVEDVVAEDEAGGPVADEVRADDEGLREALGFRLGGVGNGHAPLGPVAQEPLEERQVVGRGDEQDVADAREHEDAQGVVDHRLVVDRQQLLADRHGQGVQARARAARQHDSLHWTILLRSSAPRGTVFSRNKTRFCPAEDFGLFFRRMRRRSLEANRTRSPSVSDAPASNRSSLRPRMSITQKSSAPRPTARGASSKRSSPGPPRGRTSTARSPSGGTAP